MSGKHKKKQKRAKSGRGATAAASAVAGITVLTGGVESAAAATLQEMATFSCSTSETAAGSQFTTGSFAGATSSCMGTAPKFDTQGGNRLLDSVTFSVTDDSQSLSFISATIDATPEGGGNASTTANGVYSFSVAGNELTADSGGTAMVTATCTPVNSPDDNCPQTNTNEFGPAFSANFTDSGILAMFQMDGGGDFNFVPQIVLSGGWECSACGIINSPSMESAFDGELDISYTYTVVPLPAGLPLFGSALAAMGWYTRRRKS